MRNNLHHIVILGKNAHILLVVLSEDCHSVKISSTFMHKKNWITVTEQYKDCIITSLVYA
jgi:hypothetical protein